ncbi:nucleotidyltransferase family protein [Thermatribacter velox]|uniref:Nucleotidyltransferase family protein n=1 Tax=Thermatribacter velox TaxID=3039681 RepID=A0ABZ2YCY6_9BACT
MKTVDEIKSLLEKHKEDIRREYGVKMVGIFGSWVRGEQREGSDVDILVELERPVGLKFFEVWDRLEEILDTRVDLLTVNAVRQKSCCGKA